MTRQANQTTRRTVTGVALLSMLALSACSGPSADQSSPEAAAQSYVRLVAAEKYDEACAMYSNDEEDLARDDEELMDQCLRNVESTHRYWEENDVIGDAKKATATADDVYQDEHNETSVDFANLGKKSNGNYTLQAGIETIDREYFVNDYYFPSAD